MLAISTSETFAVSDTFFVAFSYAGRRSLANKPSSVLSVLRLLKGSEEADVERARSFSTVDIHVKRGLSFGRFHDRGNRARRTRYVSRRFSIRAT